MNGNRIYLYLLKRDKKGCKIVMTLQGLRTSAARITDIHSLKLPPEISTELKDIIHEYCMDWELWAESANSYEELKNKLISRGYSQLANKSTPLHSQSSHNNPHVADMRSLDLKKTMVRKIT